MNELPRDPVMLLSVVNTKLRDEYGSLSDLCTAYGIEASELMTKLESINYTYNSESNQFI